MTHRLIKKLGEVCEINPVKSETKGISDNTIVSFVPMSAVSEVTQRIEDEEDRRLGDVKKGYTYFKKGDILFAKITPCMENGKVALADNLKNDIGFASTEFHVIRAGKEVLSEYVFYLVASNKFREEAQTKMTGSAGQKRVPKSFLENYEIPLPPIGEQRKIVAKLEKLLAKIKEAKRLRIEAQEATKNLLSAELHKIFEDGKKKGWEEKEVGEICEHPQYGFTASSTREKIGPKLLRITDIQEGKVDWDTVPYCKCSDVEKYKLVKGDIVVARTGATVGKSYLINEVPDHAIYASYLIRLRAKRVVLPELLYYFFQSYDYWQQITHEQVGMAQPNVNGSKLAKIKILLPPLAEQKKIVAHLDALSKKIRQLQEHQQSTASNLLALEQSILHQAFQVLR